MNSNQELSAGLDTLSVNFDIMGNDQLCYEEASVMDTTIKLCAYVYITVYRVNCYKSRGLC